MSFTIEEVERETGIKFLDENGKPVSSPQSKKMSEEPPFVGSAGPASSVCWQTVRELRDKLAAAREEMEKPSYARKFHYCVDGKIRPYPRLVCSSHPGISDEGDFDPIDELKMLRVKCDQLEEAGNAMDNDLGVYEASKLGNVVKFKSRTNWHSVKNRSNRP